MDLLLVVIFITFVAILFKRRMHGVPCDWRIWVGLAFGAIVTAGPWVTRQCCSPLPITPIMPVWSQDLALAVIGALAFAAPFREVVM